MIYLDHNATTPLEARVKEKISEAEESFSNSGGNYGASLKSKRLVEDARTIIAESTGVQKRQVIFTSGATESLTLAIWNSLLVSRASKRRIILGRIEHQAVINTVKVAARTLNFEIDYISAKKDGRYDLNELSRKMDEDVSLVALMYANNETGVFQDIEEITSLCHKYEAHHLGDTTQVIGREKFDHFKGDSDYRCISAHKFYGPKGVGALIASREVIESFESVIPGGGQEFGVRGGTSNVPGIVGLAEAFKLFHNPDIATLNFYRKLIRNLEDGIRINFPDVKINGEDSHRLANTTNILFTGLEADEILVSLQKVQASKASACTTGVEEPSHVLIGMGLSPKDADSSIRFSIGKDTTEEEINGAVEDLSAAISRVLSFY